MKPRDIDDRASEAIDNFVRMWLKTWKIAINGNRGINGDRDTSKLGAYRDRVNRDEQNRR